MHTWSGGCDWLNYLKFRNREISLLVLSPHTTDSRVSDDVPRGGMPGFCKQNKHIYKHFRQGSVLYTVSAVKPGMSLSPERMRYNQSSSVTSLVFKTSWWSVVKVWQRWNSWCAVSGVYNATVLYPSAPQYTGQCIRCNSFAHRHAEVLSIVAIQFVRSLFQRWVISTCNFSNDDFVSLPTADSMLFSIPFAKPNEEMTKTESTLHNPDMAKDWYLYKQYV